MTVETQAVYQISLIAAYIAGMVALFAPCCISYLFPAYLGNIFKEKKQVLLMTFVYSLGIFVVMMPIVLGAKALQAMFFDLHDQTYLVGGVFMLFVAALSFLGIKLPMPHLAMKQSGGQKNDILSTFTLGIFSGITSACCAPVLIGVVALSSLSPTLVQSLGVGAAYVFGMVTPLYLASLFIHKRNILKNPLLKKVIWQVKIGNTIYPIFVSNIIATFIFGVTGVLMLWLTSIGKLGMTTAEAQVTQNINNVALNISSFVSSMPYLDLLFAILGIYLLYKYIRSIMNSKESDDMNDKEIKYFCPMHKDVVSDKPGKCHKCGGMDLIPMNSKNKGEDHNHHGHHHDHASMMASPEAAKSFLNRFFIVSALLVPLFIFRSDSLIAFAISTVIFYFSLVFFQHARHEIMMRQYGMMTLVSIAVGAGYLFSVASTFLPSLEAEFYLEISTLIWILLFGHYLEAKSSTAAGDALDEVAKLLPKKVIIVKNGKEIEKNLEDIEKGDVALVKSGEKVPADGIIIKGSGNFNESLVSGESKPIHHSKDDEVLAGSISIDGTVHVKLMRVGEESTIGQIKKLISEAKSTKPTAQAIADKAASYLTFIALTVALLTILIWLFIIGESFTFAITLAITVLVIACPHALGLAIPTVTTIATSLAVKNGLFIKDLKKLEVVKKADYIIFDKTGTLTTGEFGVSKIVPMDKNKIEDILKIAASLEKDSSHPIGNSIVNYAKSKKVKLSSVSEFKNHAGKGISGNVSKNKYYLGNTSINKTVLNKSVLSKYKSLIETNDTVIILSDEKEVLGFVALSDDIKKESSKAVKRLHELGLKIAMITGDNEQVAKRVSKKLSIDKYFANVLPEDKFKHVKQLQKNGNIVLMVGDGVNDAPALTQADVGVAIGSGTDVAVEAGDIVLIESNPMDVVALVDLSKKVYRKMVENLVWALGYNVVAIPAAAGLFIPLGFRLRPDVGALMMSLSSVIVVVNALSLKRMKLK